MVYSYIFIGWVAKKLKTKLEQDEELNEYTDRYDDYTFRDKFIFNPAARDVFDKYGEEAFNKMSEEEYFAEEKSSIKKYEKEFAKNGLKNIALSSGE